MLIFVYKIYNGEETTNNVSTIPTKITIKIATVGKKMITFFITFRVISLSYFGLC